MQSQNPAWAKEKEKKRKKDSSYRRGLVQRVWGRVVDRSIWKRLLPKPAAHSFYQKQFTLRYPSSLSWSWHMNNPPLQARKLTTVKVSHLPRVKQAANGKGLVSMLLKPVDSLSWLNWFSYNCPGRPWCSSIAHLFKAPWLIQGHVLKTKRTLMWQHGCCPGFRKTVQSDLSFVIHWLGKQKRTGVIWLSLTYIALASVWNHH